MDLISVKIITPVQIAATTNMKAAINRQHAANSLPLSKTLHIK